MEPQKNLRLAVLFHDFGKAMTRSTDEQGIDHFYGHGDVSEDLARKVLRRLRFDNDTIYVVTKLAKYHDYVGTDEPTMRMVRRAVNKVGEDIFPLLFPVCRADVLAQSDYKQQEKLDNLAKWEQLYHQILEEKQCVSLKTLAVTGSDLIQAGWKPGKELGQVLNRLLDLVLEDPELNHKEELLDRANAWLAVKEEEV